MRKRDIARVLKNAKKNIEKYGWIQNEYGTVETGYCALGAMGVDFRDNLDVRTAFAKAIRHPEYEISIWNDASTRTKKQVLAAFDRAIAKLS